MNQNYSESCIKIQRCNKSRFTLLSSYGLFRVKYGRKAEFVGKSTLSLLINVSLSLGSRLGD